MRLFNKREGVFEDADKCPGCRERVPQGASSCSMCGHEIKLPDREERFERESEHAEQR
jgi:rRNA maturation endonuclease Nob1